VLISRHWSITSTRHINLHIAFPNHPNTKINLNYI